LLRIEARKREEQAESGKRAWIEIVCVVILAVSEVSDLEKVRAMKRRRLRVLGVLTICRHQVGKSQNEIADESK